MRSIGATPALGLITDLSDCEHSYDDDFEDDDSPHKSLSSPSKQQHLAGREVENGDGDGDGVGKKEEGNGVLGHKDDENAGGSASNKGKDAAERKLRGDDVNLNHLDKEELDEYKRLMEIEFEKNAIKPDDPRYKHDVQVDFDEPEEDAGWDEEDDYVPSDEEDEDLELFLP